MSELDSSLEAYASINATDISHTDESALLTENETEHDAVIEADTDPVIFLLHFSKLIIDVNIEG